MDRGPYNIETRKTRGLAIGGATALAVVALPTVAAETTALASDDWVGISFWIATAAMLASTAFFLIERQNVDDKWKTSMTVARSRRQRQMCIRDSMREIWAMDGTSPLVYRYIDWLITVPLQIAEFYLIMAAIGAASFAMFRNLMGASVIMLVAGFFGESGAMDSVIELDAIIWWIIGMAGWGYILYAIWAGDVKEASESGSEGVQFAFTSMRLIVTVGWAIYPLGYVLGTGDDPDLDSLNILYNIADLVNKTAFGMMVWYAAKMDS